LTTTDTNQRDDLGVPEPVDPHTEPDPPRQFRHGWQRIVDSKARQLWTWAHGGREPTVWPPRGTFPAAAALAGVTWLAALWLAVSIILATLGFIASLLRDGADLIRGEAAARVVLEPVLSWLDAHTAGTPFTTASIIWAWAAWGIVSLLWSGFTRNPGARTAWVLFGAATIYITYQATNDPAKPIAAGIATLWWAFASTLALRGRWSTPRVIAHIPGVGVHRDGNLTTALHSAGRTAADHGRAAYELLKPATTSPGTTAPAPRPAPRPAAARPSIYERITDDAGFPGMIFGRRDELPDDMGFALTYALPTDGKLDFNSFRTGISALEMQIARHLRHQFPNRSVPANSVKVYRATDNNGVELLDEVIVVVLTKKPFITATRDNIRDTVAAALYRAGAEGLTATEIHYAIVFQGLDATRTDLHQWLIRLAADPYNSIEHRHPYNHDHYIHKTHIPPRPPRREGWDTV
jgi:hypothetical protein